MSLHCWAWRYRTPPLKSPPHPSHFDPPPFWVSPLPTYHPTMHPPCITSLCPPSHIPPHFPFASPPPMYHPIVCPPHASPPTPIFTPSSPPESPLPHFTPYWTPLTMRRCAPLHKPLCFPIGCPPLGDPPPFGVSPLPTYHPTMPPPPLGALCCAGGQRDGSGLQHQHRMDGRRGAPYRRRGIPDGLQVRWGALGGGLL